MPTRLGWFFGTLFVLFFIARLPQLDAKEAGKVKAAMTTAGSSQIDQSSLIIRYKNNQTPEDLQNRVRVRSDRARSILGRAINITEDITWRIQGNQAPEQILGSLKTTGQKVGVSAQQPLAVDRYALLHLQSSARFSEAMEAYKRHPAVEAVQANYIYHLTLTIPNDTFYGTYQWNLKKIQMEQAWDITKGDPNVKVAILDTGINKQHQDLVDSRGNLLPTIQSGGCYASHEAFALDPPAVDDPCLGTTTQAPAYSCGSTAIDDDNVRACGGGHGTQMTGIIKATLGDSKGIAGIAPEISIIVVKVADSFGQATSDSLAAGILAAKGQGANIISMSLGGIHKPTQDQVLTTAIATATASNITVFAAAGNDDQPITNFFPANDPNVITVGATGISDERSSFSNYGDGGTNVVEVSAPGGNPVQTCQPDTCIVTTGWDCNASEGGNTACYRRAAGTSHATPHAAGVAALLLAKKPSLTPNQIKTILMETGDTIITDQNKPMGKRINALRALQHQLVTGGTIPTAIPTTRPASGTPTVTPTAIPTPTPGPAITYISGKVINLATAVGSLGMQIELTLAAPKDFPLSPVSPVDLDSDGNFSFRLVTSRTDLVGKQISIQFTVKDKASGRIIRLSQPFEVTIGQEIQNVNFVVYYCAKKVDGDANCDNIVDVKDFLIWKTEFRDSLNNPFQVGRGDFNGDGITDLQDYVFLLGKI